MNLTPPLHIIYHCLAVVVLSSCFKPQFFPNSHHSQRQGAGFLPFIYAFELK